MALAKKPITFKNAVNPLTWNVPIVNKDGSPTTEFQQKWLQQATTNASIVNLTTAAGVSAVLDLITALAGSLLVRGTTRWQGLPSPADATMFLNGATAPAFAKVKDTDLAVTDVVGNNVSIAAHGFAPKAPNDATKYLDGTGAYSTPPSGGTAAASIYDDGTNIYLALVDADEQLVLDGSGFGIYAVELIRTLNIVGRTDGSTPSAGQLGEILTGGDPTLGITVATLTTALTDICFVDLTAGEWDVYGIGYFNSSATGVTFMNLFVNDVSATLPAPVLNGSYFQVALPFTNGASSIWGTAGVARFRTSTTKRVYLTGRALFTGGTMALGGAIYAHRVG